MITISEAIRTSPDQRMETIAPGPTWYRWEGFYTFPPDGQGAISSTGFIDLSEADAQLERLQEEERAAHPDVEFHSWTLIKLTPVTILTIERQQR
jgi:hypothetical protein